MARNANEEAASLIEWGDINLIVNAPLENVLWPDSWLSVLGMFLLMPFNILMGIIGLIPCVFRHYGYYAIWSCNSGHPFWLVWVWWRFGFSMLLALLKNAKSRLGLFMWEREVWGGGDYMWHSQGAWACSYQLCDDLLKSEQHRNPAFGGYAGCIPDLFPSRLLIFLPNVGSDSEWKAIRWALHHTFLEQGSSTYQDRLRRLPGLITTRWPNVTPKQMNNDTSRLERLVSSCIFFMMLGVWVTDEEAAILSGWRTNAAFFVLPRLFQRLAFNVGINKVKQLRVASVGIVEKYNLQGIFQQMNASLPDKYRRDQAVKLCDEILYAVGFAGIGGTSACCEAASAFLEVSIPSEFPKSAVDFGTYDSPQKMVAAYKKNPVAYLKETCRICPPVTSATSMLKEKTRIILNSEEQELNAGIYRPYAISLANRDPAVFPQAEVFDPARTNVDKALTWNGSFSSEESYPRICPGRYLSLDVATSILNYAVSNSGP